MSLSAIAWEEHVANLELLFPGIVAALLLIYLVYALIRSERF